MQKKRPKQDKSRDRRNYTYHPKRTFHLRWDPEPGPCYLFVLNERQAAMLRKMCQVFPKYHYIWGLPTPQRDWDQAKKDLWAEIENFVSETETCLMSGCDLNEWLKQQRMLTAAIVGEAVDLTDPLQLSPDAVDFTEGSATPGLVPSLISLLNVNRDIYPDMNAAEVLFEGLIGRRLSIGIPFEGTGLADIADEQLDAANVNLDTLQGRFRMADSSLFNPLNDEKNITEALETLLRRDKFTDLEFLTPNIVTVLENLFQLEGGSAILGLISGLYEWITGEPLAEIPETATTAEILMLIANAKEKASTEPQPITVETTTNVTTTCKCGGGCGGCGGGEATTEGEEGGEPPIGWDPPEDETGTEIVPGSPAYQSRRCKLANIVHENLVAMFIKLRDNEVLKYTAEQWGSSYLQVMSTMIGTIIGELATPFPILDGVIGGVLGYILSSILEYMIGELDIDEIVNTISDPTLQDDLVCAFYTSKSVWEARGNYVTVLQDNGMQLNNAAFVEGFLIAELLNIFFFTKSELAVEIEAQLPSYTGPVDCAGCEESVPPLFPFNADLEGWYLVTTAPVFPGLPNDNQTLVWEDHVYFPSTGEAVASSASGESCYISSPIVNYYLDPLQSHTFEWQRQASNVTYKLSIWLSDASEVILEQAGVGYPAGIQSYNLDAHQGKTVRTIELSFGAGAGSRIFVIDYINITSV